ncbi:MAG: DUF4403 family protein [Alphaproteobacteria bacterium]|nr:DUF4403 family protein [Alphaproteobacteria bacterium]
MAKSRTAASRPSPFTARNIALGALVVVVFFGGTLWAMDKFFPRNTLTQNRPAMTALPPLQAAARASQIVAPVAVANIAIRDVLEANAPRNLNGKRDNPLSDLLGKAEIGWTIARGPIGVAGTNAGLNISTTLNGSLRAVGQLANQAGNLTGAVTGLLGSQVGRGIGGLTTRALDQRADIRGNVAVTSRPSLLPNWRIEPNLAANVSLAETGMTIAGIKLNVGNEVKPLLDRTVNDQVGQLSARLRNDRTLELTARREWAKLCRSISLGAAAKDAPNLWLELRPTRAYAGQPRIVADWVILTLGVQAATRIVPSETKPDCPFPQRLDIVPQLDQGNVAIAVPIDLPFTDLNKLLEAQLKGKTFPDDKNSPGEVTVLRANVAASGERLLISLRVKARERKSWFGLGAEATVHVWGKPVLDQKQQVLQLADITLDVESEAAFGLLGAAARAAIPYLQTALAENARIDLKPFAKSALSSIDAALGDFKKPVEGVEVEASVKDLRLVGIEFDSKTLRVIAEADGTVRAIVRKIAAQ